MAIPPKFVGMPIKRREDPRLITGTATYVDDLQLPGMTYMELLRSPYAHARIVRIDTQAARHDPRVLAVLTGEDIREIPGPVAIGEVDLPNLKLPTHYPLAVGKVRRVGEPVALVVATDRYVARDALELITVEYDPLPAVVDMEKALAPGAPVVHEEWDDNLAYTFEMVAGDIDQALREAEVTIRQRILNQRLVPLAMESRGVVANYHAAQRSLELWSSTQIPHILRTYVATTLHLPENRVRVIAPEVGGGFGSKADIYAEDMLVAHLAIRLRRPVKWVEDRRENFVATIHGRGQIQDVELTAKRDGTITGLRAQVLADMGAYYQFFTPGIPTLTGLLAPGCYKIPNFREAAPADMVFEAGQIYVRGSPDRAVTFLQVAKAAYRGLNLPADTEPGLEATSSFEPSNCTFPFGAHVCIVEVDGETGDITIKRYVAVDDCGRRAESSARRLPSAWGHCPGNGAGAVRRGGVR